MYPYVELLCGLDQTAVMSTRTSIFFISLLLSIPSLAQTDTIPAIDLKEVEVTSTQRESDLQRLPPIQGTTINAGKKNEVVVLTAMDADLSTNNARQVLAKVPGVTIWESDGSGIQVGIATRGLSPNRSWEFNVRQNGYDICAEAFGYPEAYYSPPMEAVERIELIRGAASLQYGPQFGGLLNYVMKKGPANVPVSFETRQTVGSYGLFSSYNAIGGTKGKLNYYAYLHHRSADGWRENSRYDVRSFRGAIVYAASARTNIGLEYTRMDYESQQPGGLTDQLFATAPRSSTRSRNWFSAPWNVAALTVDHAFNENTKLDLKVFTTIAQRNSVGFLQPINVPDVLDPETGSFSDRQVDRDAYSNIGAELRLLRAHTLFGQKSHFSVGIRSYVGSIHRRQQGVGTTGDDLDLAVNGEFKKEFDLGTIDHAIFIEEQFNLGKRFSLIPGVRYEIIASSISGRLNADGTGMIEDREQQRQILLYGLGSEFKVSATTNVYANYSLAYRPVLYSNLIPSATTTQVDPDLKDASGYNADLGYRGSIKDHLSFDVGTFYLHYDNRIGTISRDGVPYITNIGTSVSKGVEAFAQWDPIRMLAGSSKVGHVKLFASYAYVNAEYTRWDDPSRMDDQDRTFVGNRVENAPETIARFGATWAFRKLSVTFQGSHVSEIFTDAANTVEPNASATIGKLAGYDVMDLSATWLAGSGIELRGGINNIADSVYATRRAGGYPGPGILPANGRTVWFSIGGRF